jgi:hypothetical protein
MFVHKLRDGLLVKIFSAAEFECLHCLYGLGIQINHLIGEISSWSYEGLSFFALEQRRRRSLGNKSLFLSILQICSRVDLHIRHSLTERLEVISHLINLVVSGILETFISLLSQVAVEIIIIVRHVKNHLSGLLIHGRVNLVLDYPHHRPGAGLVISHNEL